MTFTDTAWAAIAPIREAIDALPFVTQLADGSLQRHRFTYYMAQDALYLAEYSRALATAAAQATLADDIIFWSTSARDAIVVERELHGGHVADLAAAHPSPTCAAYTNFLKALATDGAYPVLAAGLLPCFWIYEDVGSRLLATAGDLTAHPYGDWLGTYSDPAFAASTRTAKALVDRLARESGEAVRGRMLAAFSRAAQYEWMFWDAAYRQESWPVG